MSKIVIKDKNKGKSMNKSRKKIYFFSSMALAGLMLTIGFLLYYPNAKDASNGAKQMNAASSTVPANGDPYVESYSYYNIGITYNSDLQPILSLTDPTSEGFLAINIENPSMYPIVAVQTSILNPSGNSVWASPELDWNNEGAYGLFQMEINIEPLTTNSNTNGNWTNGAVHYENDSSGQIGTGSITLSGNPYNEYSSYNSFSVVMTYTPYKGQATSIPLSKLGITTANVDYLTTTTLYYSTNATKNNSGYYTTGTLTTKTNENTAGEMVISFTYPNFVAPTVVSIDTDQDKTTSVDTTIKIEDPNQSSSTPAPTFADSELNVNGQNGTPASDITVTYYDTTTGQTPTSNGVITETITSQPTAITDPTTSDPYTVYTFQSSTPFSDFTLGDTYKTYVTVNYLNNKSSSTINTLSQSDYSSKEDTFTTTNNPAPAPTTNVPTGYTGTPPEWYNSVMDSGSWSDASTFVDNNPDYLNVKTIAEPSISWNTAPNPDNLYGTSWQLPNGTWAVIPPYNSLTGESNVGTSGQINITSYMPKPKITTWPQQYFAPYIDAGDSNVAPVAYLSSNTTSSEMSQLPSNITKALDNNWGYSGGGTGTPFYTYAFYQNADETSGSSPVVFPTTEGSGISIENSLGGSGSNNFLQQMALLRLMGGDIMLSFGGEDGLPIWDVSGVDVNTISLELWSIINAFNLHNIDFDLEGNWADASTVPAAKQGLQVLLVSIAYIEQWASLENYPLQIWFTLQSWPSALTPNDYDNILTPAIDGYSYNNLPSGDVTPTTSNGSTPKFSVNLSDTNVDLMDMDYGNDAGQWNTTFARLSNDSLVSLSYQIESLLPEYWNTQTQSIDPIYATPQQVYHKEGSTTMIGQNDNAGEVDTQADVEEQETFAQDNNIGRMSMWDLGRDTNSGTTSQKSDSATNPTIANQNYEYSNILSQMNQGYNWDNTITEQEVAKIAIPWNWLNGYYNEGYANWEEGIGLFVSYDGSIYMDNGWTSSPPATLTNPTFGETDGPFIYIGPAYNS